MSGEGEAEHHAKITLDHHILRQTAHVPTQLSTISAYWTEKKRHRRLKKENEGEKKGAIRDRAANGRIFRDKKNLVGVLKGE